MNSQQAMTNGAARSHHRQDPKLTVGAVELQAWLRANEKTDPHAPQTLASNVGCSVGHVYNIAAGRALPGPELQVNFRTHAGIAPQHWRKALHDLDIVPLRRRRRSRPATAAAETSALRDAGDTAGFAHEATELLREIRDGVIALERHWRPGSGTP